MVQGRASALCWEMLVSAVQPLLLQLQWWGLSLGCDHDGVEVKVVGDVAAMGKLSQW